MSTITINNSVDLATTVNNAPDNSVILFEDGDYEYTGLITLDKNVTFKLKDTGPVNLKAHFQIKNALVVINDLNFEAQTGKRVFYLSNAILRVGDCHFSYTYSETNGVPNLPASNAIVSMEHSYMSFYRKVGGRGINIDYSALPAGAQNKRALIGINYGSHLWFASKSTDANFTVKSGSAGSVVVATSSNLYLHNVDIEGNGDTSSSSGPTLLGMQRGSVARILHDSAQTTPNFQLAANGIAMTGGSSVYCQGTIFADLNNGVTKNGGGKDFGDNGAVFETTVTTEVKADTQTVWR